jgi:hypothetical protein
MRVKITLLAVLAITFCFVGLAKADYWTEQTTTTSENVIPAYFEVEKMAKSSGNVIVMYGIERIPGQNCPTGCPRHVLSYNENSGVWKDESDAAKSASGLTDLEIMNMYADTGGNVWMSNRNPGKLLKFDGTNWTLIDVQDAVDDIWPGETLSSSFVYSAFRDANHSRLYVFADIQTNVRHSLYLAYYGETDGNWHLENASGGPMDNDYYTSGQLLGLYDNANNFIWAWKWRGSESDTSIGLYKLDMASLVWTQYSASNGMSGNTGDHISDVFADSAGNVWAATRYGVFKYSGGNWTQLTKETSQITSNRVHKIQEDSDHRVWIVGLNEADIGDMETKGGMSIYDLSSGSWDYYSSKNGEDVIDSATNVFIFQDEVWLQSGHGDDADSGIYVLTRDDSHTAIYGQTSGTTVEKASLGALGRSSVKKVTIWKRYRVQKKNGRYKWKKTKVYSGRSSTGWYKKLNLDAGANIKYIIKVQGRKQRTIDASTGDPIRVNFN